MNHLPTFHQTDWQWDRTLPTRVECPCGWTEWADDQTQAEAAHGRHMAAAGVLPPEIAAEVQR